MAENTVYQWMVRRGRIGMVLYADDAEVEIEVDPQGSNFCVLELQDATDIIGILTQFAKALWERFKEQEALHGSANQYVVDESSGRLMIWQTAAGALPVELSSSANRIRFGDAAAMKFRLRIFPLTELIQWLEILVRRAEERTSA